LLLDAGVDALELPDDERHTFNHCTESKALSNDRSCPAVWCRSAS
jgi:hypothetical protein